MHLARLPCRANADQILDCWVCASGEQQLDELPPNACQRQPQFVRATVDRVREVIARRADRGNLSVLACRRASAVGMKMDVVAHWSGVAPATSLACTLAPRATSSRASSTCPWLTQQCKGVSPVMSHAFTLHPPTSHSTCRIRLFRNRRVRAKRATATCELGVPTCATARCPRRQASCRGDPLSVSSLASCPSLSRRTTSAASPWDAALPSSFPKTFAACLASLREPRSLSTAPPSCCVGVSPFPPGTGTAEFSPALRISWTISLPFSSN